MIIDKLKEDLKLAMRSKDAIMKSCVQVVLANIQNKAILEKRELSESEVLKVIEKEIKQLNEVVNQTPSGDPRKEQAQVQVEYLTRFVPSKMSVEEVETEVFKILSNIENLNKGTAMKAAMPVLKDKADGKDIAKAVDKYLTK